MTRYLWIPVLGTIAAIAAILWAHGEREGVGARTPDSPPLFTEPDDFPDLPEAPEPPDMPPPPPERSVWHLVLQPDGTLLTDAGDESFDSPEKVLERLAPTGAPRPKILLTNAQDKVSEETFNAVADKLQDRCDLTRRYFRAPPPDEPEDGCGD